MLNSETHIDEEAAVIRLAGSLNLPSILEAKFDLRSEVSALVDKGIHTILVDLSDIRTIDSAGLGELVTAYTGVANRGAKLVLIGLPTKLKDLLQVTQLATVFDVYPDIKTALQAQRG